MTSVSRDSHDPNDEPQSHEHDHADHDHHDDDGHGDDEQTAPSSEKTNV